MRTVSGEVTKCGWCAFAAAGRHGTLFEVRRTTFESAIVVGLGPPEGLSPSGLASPSASSSSSSSLQSRSTRLKNSHSFDEVIASDPKMHREGSKYRLAKCRRGSSSSAHPTITVSPAHRKGRCMALPVTCTLATRISYCVATDSDSDSDQCVQGMPLATPCVCAGHAETACRNYL
jgi:hypothetical protein